MAELSSELNDLLFSLSKQKEGCLDVVVDLRYLHFVSDDDEMYLLDKATQEKYLFKAVEDLKDLERSHSLKQLCKVAGVPYPFFCDNRPPERMRMVNSWIKATAPENGEAYPLLIKVREGGSTKVIRAILPPEYVTVPVGDLLTFLTNHPKKDVVIEVDSVSGEGRDELLFHARLVYKDILPGSEYCYGVALTTSELGSSDLLVDVFLYHVETKTYLFSQYSGQSFAKIMYTKVQPSEISEMLHALPERASQEAPRYLESLVEGEKAYPGIVRSCALISDMKGVPKKFQRAIYLEAENVKDDMETLRDFVKHAGMVAKAFGVSDRMKIERAAGSFGGLVYRKK